MAVVKVTIYRSNSTTLQVGVCLLMGLLVFNQCEASSENVSRKIFISFFFLNSDINIESLKNKSQVLMDWICF